MKLSPLGPVADALAKTERTKAQISDLNKTIQGFFQTEPWRVVSEVNEEQTEEVWRFELTREPPSGIAVRVGEILHNLRSPLDQMLCAVAVQAGKTESGVAWPFGRNVQEFEAALAEQKKLPSDALDLIRAAEPYLGGNNVLWALHSRNKRDKHRPGLIPINIPAETRASLIVFWHGLPLVLGCRTGKRLYLPKEATDKALAETRERASRTDAVEDARIRSGLQARAARATSYVLFGDALSPGDKSLEFMTTTPNPKFYTDFQPSLTVALDEVGFQGEPVVVVLHELRQTVERILLAFGNRFFP